MGLTALPDPHALDLAVRLDPRILGVTVMPTQAPGSTRRHTWLLDPRRLDLATHAKLKQITNKERIIVYFSYQKREKRKKKNSNNWSPVAIESWYVYMRRSMWKRAFPSGQICSMWYDGCVDLPTGNCLKRLLNGPGAAHYLEHVKHSLITF